MNKHSSISLYLLALVVIAAIAWAYQTPIDVAVLAPGIVRPDGDVVRIISEAGGKIAHVRAREGQTVHEGDVLVELDPRELLLKQRMLESHIHSTEIHMRQLRDNFDETASVETRTLALDRYRDAADRRLSEVALEQSHARFMQSDQLFQEGLISQQTFEDAQGSLDHAQAELEKWAPDAADVKKAQSAAHLHERQTEIDSVHADLMNQYQQLEQSQLDVGRLTIASPSAGTISTMASLHPGEILTAGTAIASVIPREHDLVIESWLPSSARHWVNPGQLVRAQPEELPADASATFDGVVLSISPDARVTDSLAAYRVLLAPARLAPPLRAGMTFRIHFITRQERLLWLLFRRVRVGFGLAGGG